MAKMLTSRDSEILPCVFSGDAGNPVHFWIFGQFRIARFNMKIIGELHTSVAKL